MAKLYFRYGAVSSAKTLNLLAVAHNYEQQGHRVLVAKAAVDTRFGERTVASRAGLEREADFLFDAEARIPESKLEEVACVLVDEAQFLTAKQIEQLRAIASLRGIPVICYGLRTDFRTKLFSGSQRLLELADSIEEVKTTCNFCSKKAVMNLRHVDGKATLEGAQVELGAEERYLPACHTCYHSQTSQKLETLSERAA